MMEDDHLRTIIHVDIDCFYAQVEMIKNPDLYTKPLGIQQKNIVVTSNYIAREFGIKKCMLLTEAKKLCPNLVLVKGEDLHDYRQMSYKVTTHLQKYSQLVERLGLDENFVDVSSLVRERLNRGKDTRRTVGHAFGQEDDICQCGCFERLQMGSELALEIRDSLREDLKLTTCAGVAHNKLLAKLAGATHKPNQQTVVFPNGAMEVMSSLQELSDIPGIGKTTMETLTKLGITTLQDLQNTSVENLRMNFPIDKAKWLYNISFGQDATPVKATGKPQSIGLEDSCKPITVEAEVRDKLEALLARLMILVNEDGRIPRTIKLIVRKFNSVNKVSHRETKQCNVNTSLFSSVGGPIRLNQNSQRKLIALIMSLFSKVVDMKRPYHITLLGLSFTKFLERVNGQGSIATFIKKNVEVQAITSIENKRDLSGNLMEYTNCNSDVNTDGSESEVEPSPKKQKFSALIARRRYFNKDYPSPSKLNVAELRINSKDSPEGKEAKTPDNNQNIQCPPSADRDVFEQLPKQMQEELWQEYKRDRDREQRLKIVKKPKLNTIRNYFMSQ